MAKSLILLLLLTSISPCAEESDLYGDGKYLERWKWLVSHDVIDGTVPVDIKQGDRDLYINAFTYAVRIKVNQWKLNSDIWWSPLLTDKFAVQHGYYMGMDEADKLCIRFIKTGNVSRF